MFNAAVCKIVGKLRRARDDVAEQIPRVAFQRFQFVVFRTDNIFLRCDSRPQKRPEAHNLDDADSVESLQEHDGIPVRHAHKFVDFCSRTHRMQVRRARLLDARIMLRDDAQSLLVALQ